MVLNIFDSIDLYLSNKHTTFWIFVLLIVFYFGYAYYCTSRGYNFSGIANFFSGGVNIGCYR